MNVPWEWQCLSLCCHLLLLLIHHATALLISMDVTPIHVQPKPLKSLKNPLLQYLRTQVGLVPSSVLRSKMTVRSEQSAAKQKFFSRLHKIAAETPKASPATPLKQQVDSILTSDHARQRPQPEAPAVSQLIQQQLQQLQAQVKQLQDQQRQQKEQHLQSKVEKQQPELPPVQPYQPELFSPAELLRQPFQLHQLQQFQDPQDNPYTQQGYQPQMMAALVGRSARSSSSQAAKANVSASEKPFANYSVPHAHEQYDDFSISKNCIVLDLPATLPRNPPPIHFYSPENPHGYRKKTSLLYGEKRIGIRANAIPVAIRESRTANTGGVICSAAITTYSDFDRPSEGILLRNGYDPMLLHSSRPTNHKPDKKACREFEPERLSCDQFLDYRSFDGICNNLREPHWGNASEAYSRVTFPTYADGQDTPRLFSITSENDIEDVPLPNPRIVSMAMSQHHRIAHLSSNLFLPIFGQFVSHDLALTPVLQARGQQPDCCAVNRDCSISECFQFSVPPFDPFYGQFNVTCHQFARSLPSRKARCHTNGMREQFSTVTHWLDGSQIYGSSIPQSLRIRSFTDGQLTFRDIIDGSTNEAYTEIIHQLLPSLPPGFTSSCKAADGHRTCFLAGDDRVNQTPMLSAIHTIFMRYHNLVARKMSQHFANWDDEQVFQEAKKFVTAVYQVVIYKELLPVLLGSSLLEPEHPLRLMDNGHFEEYDDTFNPHVLNEFTSAAFRLHTLLDDVVPRLRDGTGGSENLVLSTQFNNQTILYEDGSVDAVTAGLLEEPTLAFDRHSTIEVQGRLFRGASPFGLDLIAIDIQRGRDHGLGTYNDVRHACGKERARHFADLEDSMTPESIAVLQGLYRHVDDIDFMVGGMMEVPLTKDAAVGPAFGCVISLEFRSKRISDRYWHENPTQFPLDLLNQMRRITMAEMLCQTTGLRKVPLNAFRVPSDANPVVPCRAVPPIDIPKLYRSIENQFTRANEIMN